MSTDDDEHLLQLDPPVSRSAWSPALVAQAIEVLPVHLAPDGVRWLRPMHAASLHLGWPPERKPGDIVLDALRRYGLEPLMLHSTSWRHEESKVVLSYVAAVAEPPASALIPDGYLVDEPVARADLARGEALAPPSDIDVTQVIEHALRHLAWLVKDDEVVGDALKEWAVYLERYEPEPFRSFA